MKAEKHPATSAGDDGEVKDVHHDNRYQNYLNRCAKHNEIPLPYEEWREIYDAWLDEEIKLGTQVRIKLWDKIDPPQTRINRNKQ